MADRLDVVAVGVTDEAAVVVGVVLRPDPGLVQHRGARASAASTNARTAARSGAENAMCDSRKPSPVLCGPIQKSGIGGTP